MIVTKSIGGTLKPEILMTNPMHLSVSGHRELGALTLHKLWEADDPARLLNSIAKRVRGVIACHDLVDRHLIDSLPNLEIISNFGVGYDRVDVEAAFERGIVVTNTPGVLDDEVADLTIGLLLATVRQIPQAERYLRSGEWSAAPFPLSPTLRDRRVGILGFGNIGRKIAQRLSSFDVDIAYHSRTPRFDAAFPYYDTPTSLAKAVDVLIVIVPGGKATEGLVNAGVLANLGPNGIVVNVARGSVVDEAALIAALREGRILSAGLDVFANEPHLSPELLELENVVLLPHIGSASQHTRDAMSDLTLANIGSWFDGKGPITPVAGSPQGIHISPDLKSILA